MFAVTVCDDSAAATETRWGFRHEECNSRCSEGIDEDTCRDVEFGNVGRNGECYLNNDQNVKYRGQVHLDGRNKSSNYGNISFLITHNYFYFITNKLVYLQT